jgi:hypothetical protein
VVSHPVKHDDNHLGHGGAVGLVHLRPVIGLDIKTSQWAGSLLLIFVRHIVLDHNRLGRRDGIQRHLRKANQRHTVFSRFLAGCAGM